MKRYIQDIYDEIRNLDEAEFKIQKERLAEKLVSPFKPSGPSNNLTRKIEAFLLSSEIMPILEERINILIWNKIFKYKISLINEIQKSHF